VRPLQAQHRDILAGERARIERSEDHPPTGPVD